MVYNKSDKHHIKTHGQAELSKISRSNLDRIFSLINFDIINWDGSISNKQVENELKSYNYHYMYNLDPEKVGWVCPNPKSR